MPPNYGLLVCEERLDLIQFLNDGIRPEIPKEKSYFIFQIHPGAKEITTKIVTESELNGKSTFELLFDE